jgi:hypothetical protein
MVYEAPKINGYQVHLPTLATIGAGLAIIGYIIGWGSGYVAQREALNGLQAKVGEVQGELTGVSNRLTHVEDDARYAAQGVADLKALVAGTKR